MLKSKKQFFDNWGLCIGEDGALVYGVENGALQWAPVWLKRGIVIVWNRVHCSINGHDDFSYEGWTWHIVPGPPKCCNCGGRLRIDGKYPTSEEVAAHDELCKKNWEEMKREYDKKLLWDDQA